MSERHSYLDALARVRAILESQAERPASLPHSIELESEARAAAESAVRHQVALAALTADLGRLAAETLRQDGVAVERAMARWAARAYAEAGAAAP